MDHRVAALPPRAGDRREDPWLGGDQHLLLLRGELDRRRLRALEAHRREDLAAGAKVGVAAVRALRRAIERQRELCERGRRHSTTMARRRIRGGADRHDFSPSNIDKRTIAISHPGEC